MKFVKFALLSASALLLFIFTPLVQAASMINLYVDAAPNAYGSPNYAPWEAAAFEDVTDGTFTNMRHGVNPANVGTTNFEIQDEVVTSFGDLGLRLSWIYWIPNTTIADLKSKHFGISLLNKWGSDPESDFYLDYYGTTWLEPTKWKEYNGGVIGVAGMAYWGAKNVNTPEALAADIAAWGSVDETWVFRVRIDGDEGNSLTSVRTAAVPEPSLMIMLGLGLGAALIGRRSLIRK